MDLCLHLLGGGSFNIVEILIMENELIKTLSHKVSVT